MQLCIRLQDSLHWKYGLGSFSMFHYNLRNLDVVYITTQIYA
jgi:hypothetical protein